jgi:hypothetical protein
MNRIDRIFKNALSCKSFSFSSSLRNKYQETGMIFLLIMALKTEEDTVSQGEKDRIDRMSVSLYLVHPVKKMPE